MCIRDRGVSKDDVVKVFGTDTVFTDSAELCFITPAAKEKDLDQKLASVSYTHLLRGGKLRGLSRTHCESMCRSRLVIRISTRPLR